MTIVENILRRLSDNVTLVILYISGCQHVSSDILYLLLAELFIHTTHHVPYVFIWIYFKLMLFITTDYLN